MGQATNASKPSIMSPSTKASRSSSPTSRLSRYIKAPMRVLLKARDLYVNSLTGCAGRSQGGTMNPARMVSAVPRGHSFHSASRSSSTEEDIRDLIRLASRKADAARETTVPRSQSVCIARIDEDAPCEFGDDAIMYPRSRSVAVVPKRRAVGIMA